MVSDDRFAEELRNRMRYAVCDLAPSPGFFQTLRRRRRRQVLVGRAAVVALPGALVAASVSLALGGGGGMAPEGQARAVAQPVSFHTAVGGAVTAVITDPGAAQSQLDAIFRRHGFHITVEAVPVSPSLVGSIVYSDIGVSPVHSGACLTGAGGGCVVGLQFPGPSSGPGIVIVGRAARPGEAYASAANAFGPGEGLHCSGLLNVRVATAVPVLQAGGLKVRWDENLSGGTAPVTGIAGPRPLSSKIVSTPPGEDYVVNAIPISSTTIQVVIAPHPSRSNLRFVDQATEGC